MEKNLFRKESMDHISSPEQLHDYMRVTGPRLWMILSVILILMVGVVVYAFTTTMESTITVKAKAEYGTLYAYIPISGLDVVKIRTPIRLDGKTGYVSNISQGTRLRLFASFDGDSVPEDGYYDLTLEDKTGLPEDIQDYSFYVQVSDGVISIFDDQERMLKYFGTDRRVRLDGKLATVTGAQMYDIATLVFNMNSEADLPPDGTYDVVIITETTTPMSFLLN